MRIALVHYAYVPVIGGVEFVLEQHAGLFSRHGHEVKVICGSGSSSEPNVVVAEVEELSPSHPECAAAQDSLERDMGAFERLRTSLLDRFRVELVDYDVVFVHNLMVMHFNLAATAALAELAQELAGQVNFVNWVHDLAAINPDYALADRLGGEPWATLARALPGFRAVAISPNRQRQFCKLTGVGPRDCPVVPNGVEYLRLFNLTQPVRQLVSRYGVLNRDVVIIHPTRIVRRKNIECGVRVLAELKRAGVRCLYLVTGAPDPHNAESRAYGAELKKLINEIGVDSEFLFVSESFKVSSTDLIGLYNVSDLLFLPSRQEGFGLPLLEAALLRLPMFCPRLEPMQSVLKHNVSLFDLDDPPEKVAAQVRQVLANNPGYHARKEVINEYSWDKLFDEKIKPMFLSCRHPENS